MGKDKKLINKVVSWLAGVVLTLGSVIGGFIFELKDSVEDLTARNIECVEDRARQAGRITALEAGSEAKLDRIENLESYFRHISYNDSTDE